jgi:hypothetical protein
MLDLLLAYIGVHAYHDIAGITLDQNLYPKAVARTITPDGRIQGVDSLPDTPEREGSVGGNRTETELDGAVRFDAAVVL